MQADWKRNLGIRIVVPLGRLKPTPQEVDVRHPDGPDSADRRPADHRAAAPAASTGGDREHSDSAEVAGRPTSRRR
jgi:hypothetical protein